MGRPLLAAALLTIPSTLIEFSGASDSWKHAAFVVNWVIWVAFALDVIVSLALVSDRHRYIRTHLIEVFIVLFTSPAVSAGLQYARVLRIARVLRLARLMRVARLLRIASMLYWIHRQAVGVKRFDAQARASEPFSVGRGTLALASAGLLLWAAGQLMMWRNLHGDRAAWMLELLGPALVAGSVVNHLRHLARRFGHLGIAALTAGIVGWASVAIPFAADPTRYGTYA